MLERLAAGRPPRRAHAGDHPRAGRAVARPYLARDLHGWLGRRLVDLQRRCRARPAGPSDVGERAEPPLAALHRRCSPRSRTSARGRAHRAVPRRWRTPASSQLLGGPATHPYLPLLADPADDRAQMADGLAATPAGPAPGRRGVWTPECGYRPAGRWPTPRRRRSDRRRRHPGAAPHGHRTARPRGALGQAGVDHVLVDTATLCARRRPPRRDWSVANGALSPVESAGFGLLHDGVRIGDSDVAAFGRNLAVSYAVWNPHRRLSRRPLVPRLLRDTEVRFHVLARHRPACPRRQGALRPGAARDRVPRARRPLRRVLLRAHLGRPPTTRWWSRPTTPSCSATGGSRDPLARRRAAPHRRGPRAAPTTLLAAGAPPADAVAWSCPRARGATPRATSAGSPTRPAGCGRRWPTRGARRAPRWSRWRRPRGPRPDRP